MPRRFALVTPKSDESHIRLKGLAKTQIPIPDGFQHLKCIFKDTYVPRVKDDSILQQQIEHQKNEIEGMEKAYYIFRNYVYPSLMDRSYLRGSLYDFMNLMSQVFEKCIPLLYNGLESLEDDSYSKKLQLEKRREKRQRYKRNKKNQMSENEAKSKNRQDYNDWLEQVFENEEKSKQDDWVDSD